MSKWLRHKIWFWLICIADRISPDDAFRATGFRYRLVLNKGAVVDTMDYDKPGAMLWVQDCERHLAYDNGEFYRE